MANLLVFDSSNFIHRVFHATEYQIKDERLLPFARARLKKSVAALIREIDPVRVVAAFDDAGPSFRHDLLPGVYKAQRVEKHPLLKQFVAEAPALFGEFGCELYSSPGYEADDTMATIADQCLAVGGWKTILATNDGDLLSCIYDAGNGEGVSVLRNKEQTYHLWEAEDVLKSPKFGVAPNRLSLSKAIAGDKSDNVAGITGLGVAAAKRLATSYPNMKRIYAALDDPHAFTKAERKHLEACGLERALLMEQVTKLVRNAPLKSLA